MTRPAYSDFRELGSGAKSGLSSDDLRRLMYNELKSLESMRAMSGVTAGKRTVVQLYFPDRKDETNIFVAEIRIKEKIDRHTEKLDANIEMKKYLCKHDTRTPPVFFDAEEYKEAEKSGKLQHTFELFRALSREPKPMYFVHSELQK